MTEAWVGNAYAGAAGLAAPSFSTFSKTSRSSSGISHFDSLVSVWMGTSIKICGGRLHAAHVVIVLPAAREVFFPFCLIEGTLQRYL